MVPVSGHDVDKQVIRLAGVMARRQASKVTFIHVVEVPRSLPIDCEYEPERSRQILDDALAEAATMGFTPETELLQSREAGSAIVDEARALNADLLLIGLPRLTVAGQPSLGKTVPYVLLHAPCRVVVVRP
jgi:nucleotide-binding universal stress UspA family protein